MALRTDPRSLASPLSEGRQETKPAFWEGVLGYRHALLLVLMALLLGVFFHLQVGYGIQPSPLVLGVGGAVFTLVFGFAARRWREDRVLAWLCGIPVAITSTTTMILLAMVGGIVPQSVLQKSLDVPSAFGSWPFLFVTMIVQMNLIGSTARRCWPITKINAQYLLSHGGLALALFGGAYGAVSLERMNLVLFNGVPTNYAYDIHEHPVTLPFEATLKRFVLERFEPTLAVAVMDPKAEGNMRVEPGSKFVAKGMTEQVGGHRLEVLQYLKQGAYTGEKFVEYIATTAAPAALVRVVDAKGRVVKEGWVSSGGIESPSMMLQLNDKTAVVMPEPRPKKFRSEIVLERDGVKQNASIEVNKPLSIAGTTLYQLSYDEKMGAASEYSVIEVVRDGSIPIVYAGMFTMLAGVALMIWGGVGTSARRLQN